MSGRRELDERQEALDRIDTLRTRPGAFWIEPSRRERKTRWQRFVAWLKAFRPTSSTGESR